MLRAARHITHGSVGCGRSLQGWFRGQETIRAISTYPHGPEDELLSGPGLRAWIPGIFSVLELEVFHKFQHNPSLGSCCCSVIQLCLTLCDPVDCSTPGLPVHHQLPEFAQTHVHWVSNAILVSHPPSSHPSISSSVIPFSSCLQSFLASGPFPMSQLFASGDQSIGASASASVPPINIQDWVPSGSYIMVRNRMEKAMATHSSALAWKIPWTEESVPPTT